MHLVKQLTHRVRLFLGGTASLSYSSHVNVRQLPMIALSKIVMTLIVVTMKTKLRVADCPLPELIDQADLLRESQQDE